MLRIGLGVERVPNLMAELVRLIVDILAAPSNAQVLAAIRTTAKTPTRSGPKMHPTRAPLSLGKCRQARPCDELDRAPNHVRCVVRRSAHLTLSLRKVRSSLSCSSRWGINLEQGPRKVAEVAGVQHLDPGVVRAIEPGHCPRAPAATASSGEPNHNPRW